MNFFCTKKHYEKWLSEMNISQAHFCLPAQEAISVAERLFNQPGGNCPEPLCLQS